MKPTSVETLLRRITAAPWAITPEAFAAYLATVETVKSRNWIDEALNLRRDDYMPERMDVDGVRIINIAGVLGKGFAAYELKYFGCCDYDDIDNVVRQAVDDRSVRSILLRIDSGGGSGCGLPECAEVIMAARAQKTVCAFTDSMMGSAAYWLGSACSAVFAAGSAYVGSIGTLLPMLDVTKFYEAMGVRQELFVSGPLKGTGWPGTSLSETQRVYLQNIVDTHAGEFKAHVRANRPSVPEDAMQGGVMFGDEALRKGLVDEVCTLKRAIENTRELGRA